MEKTITMTHRLYKDEYNAEFLYQIEHGQIEGLIATDESSDKVLVIAGTLEDLQKLASLMYENDAEKIQEVFPSFITREDQNREQVKAFYAMYNELRDKMLQLYNKSEKTRYSDTKEMQMMYDIWVQMSEFSRKNA